MHYTLTIHSLYTHYALTIHSLYTHYALTIHLYGQGPVLGARSGALTTLALNIMVVSLFTSCGHGDYPISSPLHALALFLQVYADFDWEQRAISWEGPVERSTMKLKTHPPPPPANTSPPSPTKVKEPSRVPIKRLIRKKTKTSLSADIVRKFSDKAVKASELTMQSHCHLGPCVVLDPLNPMNNVSRPRTRENSRLQCSLSYSEFCLYSFELAKMKTP
jgi:hypothetical protein